LSVQEKAWERGISAFVLQSKQVIRQRKLGLGMEGGEDENLLVPRPREEIQSNAIYLMAKIVSFDDPLASVEAPDRFQSLNPNSRM